MTLEDVQARPDTRGLALQRVGISHVRLPVVVWDRDFAKQETVAQVSVAVRLSAETKGAHLSRFVEALADHSGELTIATLPGLLADVRRRLGAEWAEVTAAFPYFLSRAAPVTGARGLLDFDCRLEASGTDARNEYWVTVAVPVTSLCPCSKAISDYGAHNQRGVLTLRVEPAHVDDEPVLIWFEELIAYAEAAASSPLYPVLKRLDERHVTMRAYDKPVFVEDMVRDTALALMGDERVAAFEVHARNDESIHNHDAFASTSWSRD